MQHDLFKNITEIEKKYLKDWISLQTRFETKFSNKGIKGKAKQDLIDALRLESDDFLGEMPLKLFVSDYFVKCLLEQKHSILDGQSIVKYIAKELLEDDEFLESIVSLYPELVKSIAPERKRNRRLWELALSADGNTIQYLEKEYIDENLISLAVNSAPHAIRFIPIDLIHRELCLKVIKRNAKTYLDIPKKFQDSFDFCKVACNRNLNVWDYLKDSLKYDKFILEFCLTKSGIEGIYNATELQKDISFMNQLLVTGDNLRQRMVLAYMDNEVILKFAYDLVGQDERYFKIFKQCSQVGKKSIRKDIKDKFNL